MRIRFFFRGLGRAEPFRMPFGSGLSAFSFMEIPDPVNLPVMYPVNSLFLSPNLGEILHLGQKRQFYRSTTDTIRNLVSAASRKMKDARASLSGVKIDLGELRRACGIPPYAPGATGVALLSHTSAEIKLCLN